MSEEVEQEEVTRVLETRQPEIRTLQVVPSPIIITLPLAERCPVPYSPLQPKTKMADFKLSAQLVGHESDVRLSYTFGLFKY